MAAFPRSRGAVQKGSGCSPSDPADRGTATAKGRRGRGPGSKRSSPPSTPPVKPASAPAPPGAVLPAAQSLASDPVETQVGDNAVAMRLLKTKMCNFFQQGKCANMSCRFAHHASELRRAPNLQKTKLCNTWLTEGRCCNGEDCMYAHGEAELRVTDGIYKTQICHFFERGRCLKGARCNHAHGAADLRHPALQETGRREAQNQSPSSYLQTTSTSPAGTLLEASYAGPLIYASQDAVPLLNVTPHISMLMGTLGSWNHPPRSSHGCVASVQAALAAREAACISWWQLQQRGTAPQGVAELSAEARLASLDAVVKTLSAEIQELRAERTEGRLELLKPQVHRI